MRKDPPIDTEYFYATYILEFAEQQGTLVANKPQSLRDANEKIFATQFAEITPETIVTADKVLLHEFIKQHQQVVFKPLDSMGGRSIFYVQHSDVNINVIIETLTHFGARLMMAQRFIPEIVNGDKRILLINGEPIPFALARIPAKGEIRGNLAAGGHGVVVPLTERDYEICQQIKPILQQKKLILVGIDVIGDYLTEINVTSPTCLREIEAETKLNIAAQFFSYMEGKIR
jgi:glutathione synthase